MTFDDESSEILGRYVDALADGRESEEAPEGGDVARRAVQALEGAIRFGPEDVEILLADESPLPIPPPELPEDYEVEGEVGRGGMGVVYRARQRSLDRTVAVKVLRPGELLFNQAMQRFQREARTLARLRHRHIVSIHEVGEADGRVWFSMDYIEGESLDRLIQRGDLTPSRAVRILKQVASAVAYVHTHGLVHRDLKPANILVDEQGDAVVTDFGLALEIGAPDGLTLTGQILGTPAYMSPEQARGDGEAIGEATDVYALGAVLYECLTGRRLFEGESPPMQIYSVLRREPIPPRKIDKRVPEALELICLKALRKRPEDRYPTARALLEDLERFEGGRPIRATAPSRSYRLGQWLRRRRTPIAWATAAALVASLVFAVWVAPKLRSDPAALLEIADRRAQEDGDVESAVVLYETAFELTDEIPSEAAFRRLTEYRLRIAESHLDTPERAAETIPGLESLLEEGERRTRRIWRQGGGGGFPDWADQAHVRWTLDTARAVAAWPEYWAFGYGAGQPPGFEVEKIFARILPALVDEAHPLRRAALVQLAALANHLGDSGLAPARAVVVFGRALAGLPETQHGLHRFASLRRYACRHASGEMEEALVEALEAGGEPSAMRVLGATLADVTDIPSRLAFAPLVAEGIPAHVERLLEVVREVRELRGQEAAWRRLREAVHTWEGIEREIEAHAGEPRPPLGGPLRHANIAMARLREWFVLRTAADRISLRRAADAASWLERHAGEDPLDWHVEAVGLRVEPTLAQVPGLIRRFTLGGPVDRQAHAHFVLASLLPPDTPVPVWGTRYVRSDLAAVWHALFSGDLAPEYARARLARFVLGRDGWRTDGHSAVQPVGADGRVELRVEGEREAMRIVSLHVVPPGLPLQTGPAARQTVTLQGALGEGYQLNELRIQRKVVRPGGTSSGSSTGGSEYDTRHVFSPDLKVGGWSHPDPFRLELTLCVFEKEGDAPLGDTVEAWTIRRVSDLEAIVDRCDELAREDETHRTPYVSRRERYLLDLQRTLLNILGLATWMPLPEGRDSLRRLSDHLFQGDRHSPRGLSPLLDEQTRLALLARLAAGDEGVLDEDRSERWIRSMAPHGIAMTTAGRDGEFWIRLARFTRSDSIRAYALQQVEAGPVSGRAAGDLLDAVRWGQVEPTPKLSQRLVDGPTEDRTFMGLLRTHPWLSIPAGLILLMGLLATWRVLHPGLRREQRLVAAAWLVFIGVTTACVSILVAGFDVLPDVLGYTWAALGAWVLGGAATDPFRRVRWLLFAAAAVLAIRALGSTQSDLERLLVGIACFLAFASLPVLGRHLRGLRTGRRLPWAFTLLYVAPIGALYVMAAVVMVHGVATGAPRHVELDSFVASFFLIAQPFVSLWALLSLIQSAAVRKAWIRAQRPR